MLSGISLRFISGPLIFLFLGGAFASLFGMFHLNRMPAYHHPLFNSELFEKATDDGFFISIEADDKLYDLDNTSAFLKSIGAEDIEVIKE